MTTALGLDLRRSRAGCPPARVSRTLKTSIAITSSRSRMSSCTVIECPLTVLQLSTSSSAARGCSRIETAGPATWQRSVPKLLEPCRQWAKTLMAARTLCRWVEGALRITRANQLQAKPSSPLNLRAPQARGARWCRPAGVLAFARWPTSNSLSPSHVAAV
jgi:hypothetical protein